MKQIKDKLLPIPLIIIWLSHLVQVFVPETGFDALWYHLPIVKAMVENRGLVYLPTLYQSVNPLFADLYFALGYLLIGDLGTKIVAYLFALGLMVVSYLLTRKYLNRNWSLLLITLVSTFQVIAWQSASFYVDLAKGFFEISSLLFLFSFLFEGSLIIKNDNKEDNKFLIISGLLFGASLASKLFSIFLLPVYLFLVYLFSSQNKIKNNLYFLLSSLLLPLPFYLFTYFKTGHPFYSLIIHLEKLHEIGGDSNLWLYTLNRSVKLPLSLFELFATRDYVSFIFLVFLPILIYYHRRLLTKENLFLLIFSIFQYLLWWYLPPQSSRYAVSGFIVLTILYFKMVSDFVVIKKQYFWSVLLTILLSIVINFAPRLIVNNRSFKYILGNQTKQQYLEQFYDGSIDRNIKEWHLDATL